jgi:uncharacterized membrane protein YoaK (UPF0700 family)
MATTSPGHWPGRSTFLIALTAAAGWLDALSFLHLGKVFNSIMTGNVVFVGLGAAHGDGGLVARAGLALGAFMLGSFTGARVVGPRLSAAADDDGLPWALMLEAALLIGFAVLWLAIGRPADHPALRAVLLAVGATAMGVQAAVALALKIPNIFTVALTATIAQLGAYAGWLRRDHAIPADVASPALMGALVLTYFVGALIVATGPDWPVLSLGPVVLLGLGVTARPGRRAAEPLPAQA